MMGGATPVTFVKESEVEKVDLNDLFSQSHLVILPDHDPNPNPHWVNEHGEIKVNVMHPDTSFQVHGR